MAFVVAFVCGMAALLLNPQDSETSQLTAFLVPISIICIFTSGVCFVVHLHHYYSRSRKPRKLIAKIMICSGIVLAAFGFSLLGIGGILMGIGVAMMMLGIVFVSSSRRRQKQ